MEIAILALIFILFLLTFVVSDDHRNGGEL